MPNSNQTDTENIKNIANSENEKVENNGNGNNQTNIERADQIMGIISDLSILAPEKLAPYIGFLSSNPAALTSFGVLVDKIKDGTATRNDYVHALTSLGGAAVGVADLVKLGLTGTPIGFITSIGISLTLATIEYVDSRDYDFDTIKGDINSLTDSLSSMIDEIKEQINSSDFSDIEKNNFINMLPRIETSFGSDGSKVVKISGNTYILPEVTITANGEPTTPKVPMTPADYDAQIKDVLGMIAEGDNVSAKDMIISLQNAPKSMLAMKEVLLAKGENELAQWIDDNGKFKENTPEHIKEKAYLEAQEDNALAKKLGVSNVPEGSSDTYNKNEEEIRIKVEIEHKKWLEENEGNALSTKLGSSIGGSIGSIIIANNDYSNIEKIAISTSTTVVGQNVGEYLFWDKNGGNGTSAFDDIGTDFKNTLQGAVVSFAISSFFAKNDTLGDILGMDGTFVGGLVDYSVTFTAGYYASIEISNAIKFMETGTYGTKIGSLDGLAGGFAGALGGYLGNTFANKIMGWDTKDEALGANIGSAVGTLALSNVIAALVATGPVGWIAAVFVAFGGSAIGNVIGGIVGGLFGKKSPPPPKAHAKYEFDEEDESYN
ncbi:hypothetical protein, partial [Aliarcobacter vitoriensis]